MEYGDILWSSVREGGEENELEGLSGERLPEHSLPPLMGNSYWPV